MRKITTTQAFCFAVLATFSLLVAFGALVTAWRLAATLPELQVLISLTVGVLALYVALIATYRLLLALWPLREGDIGMGSTQEFVYHVHLLYFLIFFYPVMFSGIVPVPLMRLFYQCLGARIGANSYQSGVVFDPRFVRIGSNTILGRDSLVIPHVIEGIRLAHFPVAIGNDVTIGARAILLAGVEVGDGATVAINAVVGKGQRIGPGETWGGTPARRLTTADAPAASSLSGGDCPVGSPVP